MALTDTFIKNTKPSGKPAGEKYSDGGGLYLHIKESGKYWRYSYRFAGKQKTLALGVYPLISLAKARERHRLAKIQLADGIDPGMQKKQEKAVKIAIAANTFKLVSLDWFSKTAPNRKESTNKKIKAWLVKDVFPYLGSIPISKITPLDVLSAMRKMEARGALESVHRVKQICGQIFRFAVASGSADRDVTQDLKGALAQHLPKQYPAITEPTKLAGLLRSIYGYQTPYQQVKAAVKLSPLLLVRPGELRHAEWSEVDLKAATWQIPSTKMKMAADHIIPLPTQAVAMLEELHSITGEGRYVFPGIRALDRPISNNTVNAVLRALGYSEDEHTAHGFRATARTILDEVLGERVDLIEHQLAHAVKDANGRAYNRTSHLPARKAMMQRWADYLDALRKECKHDLLEKN